MQVHANTRQISFRKQIIYVESASVNPDVDTYGLSQITRGPKYPTKITRLTPKNNSAVQAPRVLTHSKGQCSWNLLRSTDPSTDEGIFQTIDWHHHHEVWRTTRTKERLEEKVTLMCGIKEEDDDHCDLGPPTCRPSREYSWTADDLQGQDVRAPKTQRSTHQPPQTTCILV